MWGRSIAPSWRGVCITTSSSKMQDHQQTRSRHSRSKSIDSLADLAVILSPTELMERAASEILLYTGLAFKLYSYLGLGEITPRTIRSLQCSRVCNYVAGCVTECEVACLCRLEMAIQLLQAGPVRDASAARLHPGRRPHRQAVSANSLWALQALCPAVPCCTQALPGPQLMHALLIADDLLLLHQ